MEEGSKKTKKAFMTEEDASVLLSRYSPKTVLILLQEVSKVDGDKIDWNEFVKKTATGISSARECQMLWRHLAYGQTINDEFDSDADPMDDDSDLECEMEAYPPVGRETSAEAAAYVKVLMASDYPIDSHVPNNSTIEAPLTINIPELKAPTAPSGSSGLANTMQGKNIIIPVSVEKEPMSSGVCGEKRPKDGQSGVNLHPQRRRRTWSTEDDEKLTAAVQKHGEQNWTTIARGGFNNERKPSELSQRWANIRKKRGNSNVGTSAELSKANIAVNQAIFLALDRPMGDHLKAARPMGNVGTKSEHQSQNASASPSDPQLGIVGPPKSQLLTERPSIPNSMVKAAAVAAGARIATSGIEAAVHTQNVVHITTGVSSLMKSSTASMPSQLSSNVHFSRNGPTKAPISGCSATLPSSRLDEAQEAQEVAVVSNSASKMKDLAQRNHGGNQSKREVDEHQTSASGNNTLGGNTLGDQASISFSGPVNQTQDDQVALPCSELENDGEKHAGTVTTSKEIHDDTSQNERREGL